MLGKAAQRVKNQGLTNVRLLRMDAGEMEFADNSFRRRHSGLCRDGGSRLPQAHERDGARLTPGRASRALNHFIQDSPLVAAVEKAISPICVRGISHRLVRRSGDRRLPLIKERDERVKRSDVARGGVREQ